MFIFFVLIAVGFFILGIAKTKEANDNIDEITNRLNTSTKTLQYISSQYTQALNELKELLDHNASPEAVRKTLQEISQLQERFHNERVHWSELHSEGNRAIHNRTEVQNNYNGGANDLSVYSYNRKIREIQEAMNQSVILHQNDMLILRAYSYLESNGKSTGQGRTADISTNADAAQNPEALVPSFGNARPNEWPVKPAVDTVNDRSVVINTPGKKSGKKSHAPIIVTATLLCIVLLGIGIYFADPSIFQIEYIGPPIRQAQEYMHTITGKNTSGKMTETAADNDEIAVKDNTKSEDISVEEPAAVDSTADSTTADKKILYIAQSNLNMREDPDPNLNNIICTIPSGAVCEMINTAGDKDSWVQVAYNGRTGWCNKNYLSEYTGSGDENPVNTENQDYGSDNMEGSSNSSTQQVEEGMNNGTYDRLFQEMQEGMNNGTYDQLFQELTDMMK